MLHRGREGGRERGREERREGGKEGEREGEEGGDMHKLMDHIYNNRFYLLQIASHQTGSFDHVTW